MTWLIGSTMRQEQVDTKVTVAGVRERLVTKTVIWTRAPCVIAPNFHTSGEKVMEGVPAACKRPDDSRRAAKMTGSEAWRLRISGLRAFPNYAEKRKKRADTAAHRADTEHGMGVGGAQVEIAKRDRKIGGQE